MLLPKLDGSGFYRRGTSLTIVGVTLWITTAIHLDTPIIRPDPLHARHHESDAHLHQLIVRWHLLCSGLTVIWHLVVPPENLVRL